MPEGWELIDERSTGRKKAKKSKKAAKQKVAQAKAEAEILKEAYTESEIDPEIPTEDPPINQGSLLEENVSIDETSENIEELVSEPFEEAFLHIVPDDFSDEEVTQGSFWDDDQDMQPSEEKPLLQRAFRVVNDE